jgi:archaellum biogenesis ATPase FlaH
MPNKFDKLLETALKKHKIIMVELPTEDYLSTASVTVKFLVKKGFGGVYISFHRPYKNICSFMKHAKISMSDLYFVDFCLACQSEHPKSKNLAHLSNEMKIDDIVRSVYTHLSNVKSKKKFIFIDSLTTITLYKRLSDIMKLSEFLVRTSKEENTLLIFNVPKDLAQKKFIRDIAFRADKIIDLKK